jgi:hypothetical protein
MLRSNLARLGGLVVVAALFPGVGRAQEITTFEDLQRTLKRDQTVVVVDDAGLRIRGKVQELSPSSLIILTKGAGRRTFVESTVAEVRRPDSVANGALMGAGVGAGLALWDYLIDPSEPGNGVITVVSVGLGAAIGAGIDALINKSGKVLYRSPRHAVNLGVTPLLQRHRQGVSLSVRF